MTQGTSVTLPCPRCGATLPVDPTAPATTCGYCRITVPVPAEMRRQAVAHTALMSDVLRRADASRQALAYGGFHKHWWRVVLGLFAGTVGVGLLQSVLPHAVAESLSFLPQVLFCGALVLYFRAYQRAGQRAGAPLSVATSICERCGGPLAFAAGSARAVCPACSAVAVAGRTLQGDLLSAAEREARRLDLERARSDRQRYRSSVGVQRFSRGYTFLMVGGPIVALVGVLLAGGAYQLVGGVVDDRAPEVRQGLVRLLFGVVGGVIGGGVAAWVYTHEVLPARAGGPVLRALAARLGGRVTDGGPTAAIDWLDTCWLGPAPYEVMLAQQEMARYTLATTVEGLPALVVVIADSASVRLACKRLHVLVAAPREPPLRARDRGAAEAQVTADLRGFGFEVAVSEDGIALARETADPAVLNETSLGWALRAAAALARA